jgi:U4/U6 small nuclear ribonucleoprotein PRP31
VPTPLEYVMCVKLIRNEQDLSQIKFANLLTNHQIMSLNVASSHSIGPALKQAEMTKVMKSCDTIFTLDEHQKNLMKFVEGRMKLIAPNLSMLIGAHFASKLMSLAGGIDQLSKMPACNIQVMGS